MVTSRQRVSFRQDESGIALSEALITFPLVLLVFAALVEFGFAMSQWNQTVKALQYGARLATVSDPLTSNFDDIFPTDADDPLDNGTATPNDATVSSTCGPNLANCSAALSRIVTGSDGVCGPVTAGRRGMCDLNWSINEKHRITPDKLVVTYQRSGLGYWGRPNGPVLTMRLEVRGITFDLPILGGLLGLDGIPIPAHPVTITTEDLKTCSTC
ncbi:pilus assembly protein [Ensifer sp. IC3342]|nr:pilus assembly protein [Ensifer sp. BRP08]MCA1448802.1 pilus assembly protein [Ensifer sp. IC3342]